MYCANNAIIIITILITAVITLKTYAVAVLFFMYLGSDYIKFTKNFGLFKIIYQESDLLISERLYIKYKD